VVVVVVSAFAPVPAMTTPATTPTATRAAELSVFFFICIPFFNRFTLYTKHFRIGTSNQVIAMDEEWIWKI
jgi:hypothetical protein